MTYDKTSFLAGVSVGAQLKGWSGYPSETLRQMSMTARRMLTPPPSIAVSFRVSESSPIAARFVLPPPPHIVVENFEEG